MNSAEQAQELVSSITPVTLDATTLRLRANHIDARLDLDLLLKAYPPMQVLHPDPLILRMSVNAHAVVLRFGAIVFWECQEALCDAFLEKVRTLQGVSSANDLVQDTLLVRVGQGEDLVNFKDVGLKVLTLEHIKIISETLGQSVALKQCEISVDRATASVGPIVDGLRTRGQFHQSSREVLKTVGFTMAVRETILTRLTLFDDPPEAWRSERLARLHGLLDDHFDLKKRLSGLQVKLTFLSDLSSMLMNVLQNRYSHRLEWIIIALILFEVMFTLITFGRG